MPDKWCVRDQISQVQAHQFLTDLILLAEYSDDVLSSEVVRFRATVETLIKHQLSQ